VSSLSRLFLLSAHPVSQRTSRRFRISADNIRLFKYHEGGR